MKLLIIGGSASERAGLITQIQLSEAHPGVECIALDTCEPGGTIGYGHGSVLVDYDDVHVTIPRDYLIPRDYGKITYEAVLRMGQKEISWLQELNESMQVMERQAQTTAEQLRGIALQLQAPQVASWSEVYYAMPGQRVRSSGHRTPARDQAQRRRAKNRTQRHNRRHNR